MGKKSDLEKLKEKLRKIPGMSVLIDQARAELKNMRYTITVGPLSSLDTALELVKITWGTNVTATLAMDRGLCTLSVYPVNDAAATEFLKDVNSSLPSVAVQVSAITGKKRSKRKS